LSSCAFLLINKCIISYLLIYRHILRLCAPSSLYSLLCIDYWFLSVIYHTHLCTDLSKSPSDTKILAYYYPWNHFSLKVDVPDEMFGFKAEGILNYIIAAHIIAITVSHGVDLRFEPNSIYNNIDIWRAWWRICVNIESNTHELALFWIIAWKAINNAVGNL